MSLFLVMIECRPTPAGLFYSSSWSSWSSSKGWRCLEIWCSRLAGPPGPWWDETRPSAGLIPPSTLRSTECLLQLDGPPAAASILKLIWSMILISDLIHVSDIWSLFLISDVIHVSDIRSVPCFCYPICFIFLLSDPFLCHVLPFKTYLSKNSCFKSTYGLS